MLDDQRMPEEWIVQVEGREYGPVELQVLREWKEEGRVLATNPARRSDTGIWIKAGEIPGLFGSVVGLSDVVVAPPAAGTLGRILARTLRIYRKGFFQFLCLTLLVIVPSACAQLTGAVLDTSPGVDADLRSLLAGGFGLCMLLLTLGLWPIYISGIQLLTAELNAGRSPGFFPVLNQALKFWLRVAVLCVFVYGSYLFWTILPIGLILILAVGAPSLGSFFLALVVLAFQVWIVGRLYINFMFWQQFAVLPGNDPGEALRNSKALARSQQEVIWYKRPLWRGVFIASLWFLFVLGLNLPLVWPALRIYFNQITVSQDVGALAQALAEHSRNHGANMLSFAISLFQGLLRPLLGIAFVLLYFDASSRGDEGRGN
jgi:hypothetical protein